MLTFALIKPNDLSFVDISNDKIMSKTFGNILRPHIEIISVDTTDTQILLQNIVEKIGMSPTDIGDSFLCFETHKYLYYLIYKNIQNNTQSDNLLGRLLSRDHCPIIGSCALIKTKLNDDNNTTSDNINFDDVVELYTTKIIHKITVITENNILEEKYFSTSPLDQLKEFDNENGRYVTTEFLGKTIYLFMQRHPTKCYLNRMATILYKKYKIIGDVVVAMITHDPIIEYNDVDIDLFKKIMAVMSCSSFSRTISESEDVNGMVTDGTTKVTNFYKILNDRYNKYKTTNQDDFDDTIPDDVLHGPTLNETLT